MARSLPRNVEKISKLGDRPSDAAFRTANIIFFLMAMFFGVVYFIIASTDEVGSNTADHLKDDLTTYIILITSMSLILLIMEFYPSLSGLMKVLRLGAVVILIIFVALSIEKVIDLAQDADDNAGKTIVYTFAALTLGFAGVAGVINGLEVAKNSGY